MTSRINSQSYWKIILHAAKYAHLQVFGVLLGTRAGDNVDISDAIPLFHGAFILAPMLEVAMMQVRFSAISRHLCFQAFCCC